MEPECATAASQARIAQCSARAGGRVGCGWSRAPPPGGGASGAGDRRPDDNCDGNGRITPVQRCSAADRGPSRPDPGPAGRPGRARAGGATLASRALTEAPMEDSPDGSVVGTGVLRASAVDPLVACRNLQHTRGQLWTARAQLWAVRVCRPAFPSGELVSIPRPVE